MKTAENIVQEYYTKNFENGSWIGLEQYAERFKVMYFKEVTFLREMNTENNEKDIAFKAIKTVNESYNKSIKRFSNLINKLPENN